MRRLLTTGIVLLLLACSNDRQLDLPSIGLQDTLINEAITLLSQNLNNTDSSQLAYMVKEHMPIFTYKLNKNIRFYSLVDYNNYYHSQFSNRYLLSSRFKTNTEASFSASDTEFINQQIINAKQLMIPSNFPQYFLLTDSIEIKNQISSWKHAAKIGIPFSFSYIEIFTPLFNKKKDLAIIGISSYAYTESINMSFANYTILKKNGNKWKALDEIMWWSK